MIYIIPIPPSLEEGFVSTI